MRGEDERCWLGITFSILAGEVKVDCLEMLVGNDVCILAREVKMRDVG